MTNLLKKNFKILIVTIGLHFSLCTYGMSWDAMRGRHVTPARNPAPIPLPHLERAENNPTAQQTLGRLLTTAQHQEQSRSFPSASSSSLSSSETSAFRPYSSSSSRTGPSLPSRPEISLELDAEGWQLTAPENRAPAWDDVRGWYLVPSSEQTRRPLPPFEQVRTYQPAERVLDQRTSSQSSSSSSSSSSRKRGKESEESSTGQFKRPCPPARATGQIPTALVSPEQAAQPSSSSSSSPSSSSTGHGNDQPLVQVYSALDLLNLSPSLSPEAQNKLKRTVSLSIQPSALFDNTPGFFINIVAKYFPNLLHLDLTKTRLSDNGFQFLAKSSLAPKLKVLAVENCGITDSSFTTQNLNRFARLEYFNVKNNPLTDAAITAFANSRLPWRMTNFSNTLNLELLSKALHARAAELTSQPLIIALDQFNEERLSQMQGLENRGALRITPGTGVTTDPVGIIKLIEKYFPNILSLQLSNVALGNAGFTALAKSSFALQLNALDITGNITTDSFTQDNLDRFNSLSRLIVRGSILGATGFKALTESKLAPQLIELALIAAHIPKEVFTTNNFNMFKQLTRLGLDGNQLGDEGFTQLADSIIAPQLQILTVSGCGITDSSFTTQNLNRFVKLEIFDMKNNPITDAAITVFANSRLPWQLKQFFNNFNKERLTETIARLNELRRQSAASKN